MSSRRIGLPAIAFCVARLSYDLDNRKRKVLTVLLERDDSVSGQKPAYKPKHIGAVDQDWTTSMRETFKGRKNPGPATELEKTFLSDHQPTPLGIVFCEAIVLPDGGRCTIEEARAQVNMELMVAILTHHLFSASRSSERAASGYTLR